MLSRQRGRQKCRCSQEIEWVWDMDPRACLRRDFLFQVVLIVAVLMVPAMVYSVDNEVAMVV